MFRVLKINLALNLTVREISGTKLFSRLTFDLSLRISLSRSEASLFSASAINVANGGVQLMMISNILSENHILY